MTKKLAMAAVLLVASSGCTLPVAGEATVATPAALPSSAPSLIPSRSRIALRVAAHQHLISEASLPKPPAQLPPIALPPELQSLLDQHTAAFGSKAVTDLYAPEAQMVRDYDGGDWVRGRASIVDYLSQFRTNRRLVANAYKVEGATGFIAGTVVRTNGSLAENFLLGIAKDKAGKWHIESENLSQLRPPEFSRPITADQLIQQMDDAGVERGVVLSIAYWFGSPTAKVDDEESKVAAENDWNVAQVGRFPDRLTAFCGVNPLKPYAIAEMDRCSRLPNVAGMKLHFGNSQVDLTKAEHVAAVRAFFRAANARKMALLVHTWTSDPSYGARHSQIFLDQLLPEAPDVPIQIAHLAGAGINCDPDAAVEVFARAIAQSDPRTRNLVFDVTQCVALDGSQSADVLARLAGRLRQIGLDRILVGSDTATDTNPPIGNWWAAFRRAMPLTDSEIATIADNVPPYLR